MKGFADTVVEVVGTVAGTAEQDTADQKPVGSPEERLVEGDIVVPGTVVGTAMDRGAVGTRLDNSQAVGIPGPEEGIPVDTQRSRVGPLRERRSHLWVLTHSNRSKTSETSSSL